MSNRVWVTLPKQDGMAPLPEAVIGKTGTAVRAQRRVPSPVLAYKRGTAAKGRGVFEQSEYDLSEIARAEDTEAYVKLAFQQITTLILKEAWSFKGRNQDTVAYIAKRIRNVELNSNKPFDLVLRQIVRNFVRYSNAFIVKVRDETRAVTGAKFVKRYGRNLAPVAGLFSVDPTSVEVERDTHGHPKQWRQHIPGTGYRTFRKENIVHLNFDKKDGFAFGTPWIVPVLDDIRTLRRIEELADMLVNRHLFPLYHYKVGTENSPALEYDNGMSEVMEVQAAVENMPSEGAIVTPERHEIVAIDAKAMDARAYLDYFENRVFTGLRLSTVDIGRGDTANRATGAQMQLAKSDLAKDMQDVIRSFITFFIFDEWLEEGGFPLIPENRVWLEWAPINPEEQRNRDNHIADMYMKHLITESEAREACGYQPFTEEQRKDTFLERIEARKTEFTTEAQKDIDKSKSVSQNQNKPTNQFGTKAAKGSTARDGGEDFLDPLSFAMGHLIDRLFNYIDFTSDDSKISNEILFDYHARYRHALKNKLLTNSQIDKTSKTIYPLPDKQHEVAFSRLALRINNSDLVNKIGAKHG